MRILVTGCAGFIGYHLCLALSSESSFKIFGIDNLNNYYDVNLKKNRLKNLRKTQNFIFKKIDLINFNNLNLFIKKNKIDIIINLAAQAGVRFSIEKPEKYFDSNFVGFFNILEASRLNKIKHLIYASSSSVYGDNENYPLKENSETSNPLSFYAASKKTNEIMAESYNTIYKLKSTGLRFFTVYGPYGRPDMSLYKFCDAIHYKKNIYLYNNGKHLRDFTYVDDVIKSILIIVKKYDFRVKKHKIFNICSNNPKSLKFFLRNIEKNFKGKTKVVYLKKQKGDVYKTHGDNQNLIKFTKFKKFTSLEEGIVRFIDWYKKYHKVRY